MGGPDTIGPGNTDDRGDIGAGIGHPGTTGSCTTGSGTTGSGTTGSGTTGSGTAGLSIAGSLREGALRLAGAGIPNPRLESRLLLAHALDRSSEQLIRDLDAETPPSGFASLVMRRAGGEPLAFILGYREFWSLRFNVSAATLIPRPESETVVEAALAICSDGSARLRVLDLGTGTGCLLLAVLHERPAAFGVGVDRSAEAVNLARGNASELGFGGRAVFVRGDWAAAIDGRFDLVLSNPPYVSTPELARLEVAMHEPRLALDGGDCGLTAYRAIIGSLPRLLAPGGAAVLELGAGQSDRVAAIAAAAGLRVSVRPDLSGIARALIVRPSG